MSDEVIFTPAPGWPPPPPNWTPPAGWRPDPAWPASPPGWSFYRRADGTNAAVPAGGWEPPTPPTGGWPSADVTPPAPTPQPSAPPPPAPSAPWAPAAAAPPPAPAPASPWTGPATPAPWATPGAPADPARAWTAQAAPATPQPAAATPWTTPAAAPTPDPYASLREPGGVPPAGLVPGQPWGSTSTVPVGPNRRRNTLTTVIISVVILALLGAGVGIAVWRTSKTTPLTQAQFNNLGKVQLPAKGFAAAQFDSAPSLFAWFECPVYQNLGGDDALSMYSPDGGLDSSDLRLANFRTNDAAMHAGQNASACLAHSDGITVLTTDTAKVGDVTTWTFGVDWDGQATFNFAVERNILVVALDADPAQWTTFVSTTLPAMVNAARKS